MRSRLYHRRPVVLGDEHDDRAATRSAQQVEKAGDVAAEDREARAAGGIGPVQDAIAIVQAVSAGVAPLWSASGTARPPHDRGRRLRNCRGDHRGSWPTALGTPRARV